MTFIEIALEAEQRIIEIESGDGSKPAIAQTLIKCHNALIRVDGYMTQIAKVIEGHRTGKAD